MLVSIDHEFCEASGECLRLVPEVFVADADNTTRVTDGPVPEELEDDVRLAADSCPRLAIMLS